MAGSVQCLYDKLTDLEGAFVGRGFGLEMALYSSDNRESGILGENCYVAVLGVTGMVEMMVSVDDSLEVDALAVDEVFENRENFVIEGGIDNHRILGFVVNEARVGVSEGSWWHEVRVATGRHSCHRCRSLNLVSNPQ